MDNRNDTFIGSRWFYAICTGHRTKRICVGRLKML